MIISQIRFSCLLFLLLLASCGKIETTDNNQFKDLKIYSVEVNRIKKIQGYFVLIGKHEITFLDSDGTILFNYTDKAILNENTFDFKFTDVVEEQSGNFLLLGTEIGQNHFFKLYIVRLDNIGKEVWDKPKTTTITQAYEYDSISINKEYNYNFTNKDNGYALGTCIGGFLVVVVNYQNKIINNWRYRIVKFSENGNFTMEKDYESDNYHTTWTYLIGKLSENKLILVRGGNLFLDIQQYDLGFLNRSKVYSIGKALNFAILTNMLLFNEKEIVFTGHADRRNNILIAENYDVFCLRYNFITNTISDSLFSGEINNNELSYNSYLDNNKIIHCIGTRRGELLSTPGLQSSLFEVRFDLLSHKQDSVIFIKNRGYEGLFSEPIDGANNEQKVLGYKFDISGKQNIQGFYLKVKHDSP